MIRGNFVSQNHVGFSISFFSGPLYFCFLSSTSFPTSSPAHTLSAVCVISRLRKSVAMAICRFPTHNSCLLLLYLELSFIYLFYISLLLINSFINGVAPSHNSLSQLSQLVHWMNEWVGVDCQSVSLSFCLSLCPTVPLIAQIIVLFWLSRLIGICCWLSECVTECVCVCLD